LPSRRFNIIEFVWICLQNPISHPLDHNAQILKG
jgi:hypothetical protein